MNHTAQKLKDKNMQRQPIATSNSKVISKPILNMELSDNSQLEGGNTSKKGKSNVDSTR